MELVIKPISKMVVEVMKHNKYTIMFSGLCKYKDTVYNFYAFNEHYCPDKGYPSVFMLESMDECVYFQNVKAEDCEVLWSPQANRVSYKFSYN